MQLSEATGFFLLAGETDPYGCSPTHTRFEPAVFPENSLNTLSSVTPVKEGGTLYDHSWIIPAMETPTAGEKELIDGSSAHTRLEHAVFFGNSLNTFSSATSVADGGTLLSHSRIFPAMETPNVGEKDSIGYLSSHTRGAHADLSENRLNTLSAVSPRADGNTPHTVPSLSSQPSCKKDNKRRVLQAALVAAQRVARPSLRRHRMSFRALISRKPTPKPSPRSGTSEILALKPSGCVTQENIDKRRPVNCVHTHSIPAKTSGRWVTTLTTHPQAKSYTDGPIVPTR